MTLVKRTQGRPPRSSGINGRDKLIEATRVYLQSNRKMSLTRTEIAQGCGVTPALISYYFKDKRSLLDAVTKPLIGSYLQQLTRIVSSKMPAPDRMRDVIRLLIRMNMENAFLIEYLLRDVAAQRTEAEDQAVIDAFHHAISDLLGQLIHEGAWRASDLLMAEVALWGMCRAFGETLRVQAHAGGGDDALSARLAEKVEFVFIAFVAPSELLADCP